MIIKAYHSKYKRAGNLLIGSAYTKQLGLKPGDEFYIALGRKHIILQQVEAPSEDATENALAS